MLAREAYVVRAFLHREADLRGEDYLVADPVSRPYDELQATIPGEDTLGPEEYLRHRLARFEEYFGIKAHEDLQAPSTRSTPKSWPPSTG